MAEIVDFGLQQHKIKMDSRYFENVLSVVAGDTGRRIEVQLLDTNGMVQDTTGLNLRLNAEIDGKATYTDATLVDAPTGKYQLDLSNGMFLAPGNWQFQWQITDYAGKKLHSFAFTGNIGKNISEGGSQATNFYLNLEDLKKMQDDLINGTIDSSILETNIAEKLTDLETQYAPKLTEVTAQLAQIENEKAEQTTVANQQAQINSLVIGSGTSSAEVVQSRVDAIGSTFPTAKGHLDNIEQLIKTGKSTLSFADWINGAILTDGSLNTITTYLRNADLHYLDVGTRLQIIPAAGYKFMIAWYDGSETFVKRDNVATVMRDFVSEYPYYRLMIGYNDVTALSPTQSSVLTITAFLDSDVINALEESLSSGVGLQVDSIKTRHADFMWHNQMVESGIVTTAGYFRNAISGLLEVNASYNAYDYVPIDPSTTYYYYGFTSLFAKTTRSIRHLVFCDANKVAIPSSGLESVYSFTSPANAKYCTVSVHMEAINHLLTKKPTSDVYFEGFLKDGTFPISTETVSDTSLEGDLVYSFGDSLFAGHYSSVGIADGLAAANGMVYTKYAANGAKVIGDIYTQINNASATIPDFVVFDGFTNDAYDDIVTNFLGAITTSYAGTYDTATFYGAFESICYLLKTKYKTANIIYVAPHKMPTRSSGAQEALYTAVKKVCQKWAIPIVDIYNEGQINTNIDVLRNDYSYNALGETSGGNGTHLTGVGYDKFYAPQIKATMLKLRANS